MSEELLAASERLIARTGLLAHSYGMPAFRSEISPEMVQLQAKYVRLYGVLLEKLDKLLYFNKLKELQLESPETINEQFEEIIRQFPAIETQNLESFFVQQNNVKTKQLLGTYLQTILPILRSIHTNERSKTEASILAHLQENFAVESGSTFEVMKNYQLQTENDGQYTRSLAELEQVLGELKPKLAQFNDLHTQTTYENSKYLEIKASKLSLEDDIVTRYRNLVEQWQYLSKICDFLPMLIVNLSVNWYEEKSLFSIINLCQEIASKLTKYQLIISMDNFDDFSAEDLAMLEFEEIE